MVLFSIGDKLKEIVGDAFGVNLTELVINVAATIVLILIVRFFFWNKVTDFLEKKRQNIKDEYKESEDIKKEALEMHAEAEANLATSRAQASEIIRTAEDTASKEKARIIEEAKLNADEIIKNSKEEAQKEKESIIREAKEEVVDIASLIASKMIDENIDKEKYNDSILDSIEE